MGKTTVRIPIGVFSDGSGWISGPADNRMDDLRKTRWLEREVDMMEFPKNINVQWIEVEISDEGKKD